MLFPEEDAPVLKAWIVKRIENTSDADSDVLADYVIALLKHDGDLDSVRKLCEEEIPDFLTEEPTVFLNDVFQAIKYRSYVPGAPPPPKQAPPGVASLPAAFNEAPLLGDQLAPFPTSGSKKRGFHDRGDFDAPDGRDMSLQGGGRAQKQPRRGGRRGRMDGMGDGRRGGFPAMGGPSMPGMPLFDPNNPMEAMMQLQAMGIPYPGMPEYTPQAFRGGRGRGRRRERCPDFETKGFCSRGSTCTYDHGNESVYFPPMGANGDEYDPGDMSMSSPQNQMNPFSFMQDQGRGRAGRRRGRGGKRGGARASFSAEGPVNDRTKSTIVIENIPEESFSEEAVRDFFAQFGNIVEISMQPYKHLAIVKYDKWGSANAAYRSPKVIFDNRFVKVFWFKDDGGAVPPSMPSNGADGSAFHGHAESEGAEPEPEVDMEEFQRRQEEAQKQHQERESRKFELEQKRQELEKQQQDLLAKHREESERLQAKLVEKTGGDASATSSGTDMLRAKLAVLEQEAKILGIDPNAADESPAYATGRGGFRGRGGFQGRGYTPRRRGGFRGHDGRHAAYAQYSIDNRPRKLAVTGVDFTAPDKDEVLRHYLLNLGEFESVDTAPSATHVSFQDRKSAEKFYYSLNGKELPGVEGKLELAWVNTPLPPVSTAKKETAGDAMGDGDEESRDDDQQPPKQREEEGQMNMDYELADDEAW